MIFSTQPDRRACSLGGNCLRSSGHVREKDRKLSASRACVAAAPDADRPLMLLYDTVGQPEAQTCACVSLGGIERLENAGQVLALNAAAVVGNSDAYSSPPHSASVAPLAASCHVQRQTTAVVECIESVEDKVREKLTEFAGKAAYFDGRVISFLDLDVLFVQAAQVKLQNVFKRSRNVQQ